jgi:2-amino-4-hydroxy-6-hydroxymethyldihydropteridine diphosphokinase
VGEVLQGFIALGANLGDRLGQLQAAVARMAQTPGLLVVRVSSIYESPAWGFDSPHPFYNAVAEVVWANEPLMLLDVLQAIEALGGRERPSMPRRADAPRPQYADRTIDLDMLWLAGLDSAEPRLLLPHPQALNRAFVLLPWLELAPQLEVRGQALMEWVAQLPLKDLEAVKRVLEQDWLPGPG